MIDALIDRNIETDGDNVQVTETWDLNHPDCPIDLINRMLDNDVEVSVVCFYEIPGRVH